MASYFVVPAGKMLADQTFHEADRSLTLARAKHIAARRQKDGMACDVYKVELVHTSPQLNLKVVNGD